MLTLDLNKTGGSSFPEGWTTVLINDAKEGKSSTGTRYIDLFFQDQPDTLHCRIYTATNTKTNVEFGIANLFHHAWAGIVVDEETNTATIDDDVRHLKGKTVNVLFYRNENGYTDAVQRIAPVLSEHFTEDDVTSVKSGVERYHAGRKTKTNGTVTSTTGEAVPF